MTIDKKLEGTKLEITLEGRLDTITAPTLEGELKQSLDGITELVFDFGIHIFSRTACSSCSSEDYEQAGKHDHKKCK